MANKQKWSSCYTLEDYLSKNIIKDCRGDTLRWLKDILNTKVSLFDYKGLPDDLTPEILENALLFNNFLCFWKSPALGLVLCRYIPSGEWSIYWKPVRVDLIALSGKPLAYSVPYEDIVLVRDNRLDIIPFITLSGWISKIVEMENTLGTLVKLVRFPTVITGTPEQVADLKLLLKKNADCEGFIIADKGFSEHMEQFPINLPAKVGEIYELMDDYKANALASMGIYSADEKKERLITNEVQAQNDYTDYVYQGMVEQRKQFIQGVKDKWGIDIELVELYKQVKQEDPKEEDPLGGKDNG